MAWFKDLAGKAEDLLNQIDQNAAVAFQNEKKEKMNSPSPTWESFQSGSLSCELAETKDSYQETDALAIVVDSGSTTSEQILTTEPYENGFEVPNVPEIITVATNDALEYSTSVRNIDKEMFDDAISVKKVPTDLPQDEQNDQLSEALVTTMHIWQQAETEKTESEKHENSSAKSKSSLMADHAISMRELQNAKTDNELLQRRLTAVETDCNEYKDRVAYLQQQWNTMTKMQTHLRDVNEKMSFLEEILKNTHDIDWHHIQDSDTKNGVIGTNKTVQLLEEFMQIKNEDKGPKEDQKLVKQLGLLHQLLEHFSRKLEVLSVAVKKSETERQEALQLEEIARRDAVVARQDFDQYKLRAQRILQDKERALAQLRGEISDINSGVTPTDDTHYLELQALRHEHEVVCEEVLQLEARLQGMREELCEAERRLATARDTERRLQEALESERRARQAAEDDCRAHIEELRAVREDLFVQQSTLTTKVRDREIELNKLRKQLSQRPVLPSSNDVESRLHSLTHALVQKQSAVETLTAERNAAQLQLEKLEHKHQELLTHIHRSPAGFVNLNDTDDAKAQVPSLFVESPFDTGVTRRVKRAYTTLDAVSIRTGVFLRRYPLARVLVFSYMILLHIWVMVVLFTYTPSAQGGQ
ncbi:golgin-84-like isoform X1 [Schistocerca cancellata]|uniref:golgin-84-like isoform X1 n=1 Tax=Schistocerca cancellata TaxID=274614 RepID=UPI0021186D0C|nr:golgin-84-like isoform X1 [Schistocerca cancellata]